MGVWRLPEYRSKRAALPAALLWWDTYVHQEKIGGEWRSAYSLAS